MIYKNTFHIVPKLFSWQNIINPFTNKPLFLRVWRTNLLKTLWEKGQIAGYEQFLPFP